jgi:hypothetical protein
LVRDNKQVPEAIWSQNEEAEVGRLAKQFATKVPELEFSPAKIQSFLLVNKRSPGMAVVNVDQWITKTMKERKKVKNKLQVTPISPKSARTSETTKSSILGDSLPETARASEPELKTEGYVSNEYKSSSTKDPFSYYHFPLLITALIEMVYCGPTLSLPVSPPESLYPLPVGT